MFTLLAQTDPASCTSAALLPLSVLAIFYFLVFRPQQKQLSESKAFREGLKVGDEVVTAGGIFGRVARLETDEVELEVASKLKIRVLRSQVVQHAPKATLEVKD